MSAEDSTIERGGDSLSSFKVTRNATGKVQLEVKVYAESNSDFELEAAKTRAQRIYDELDAYYAPGGAK